MTSLGRRLRRRSAPSPEPEPEAGAALLLVIMLVLVVASLGIVVTASVVQQVRPTGFVQKNTRTVFAAEAGIQAALGQLRSAAGPIVGGQVSGDPAELPCSVSGPVGQSGDGLAYSVTLTYFTEDPTGQTAAWRNAHALACSPTSGLVVVPHFALLASSGTAYGVAGFATSAGDRSLVSLYTFKTSNANVSGGRLFTVSGSFCVQADSATAGSLVHYTAAAKCISSAPLQTWQWDTDYRIRLTSTVTEPGAGLCLTGAYTGSVRVTLSSCDATRNDQLFSYEGGSHFRGQNVSNTDYSANCLRAGSATTALEGLQLTSGPGCGSGAQEWASWAPEPQFGAGAASKATDQLVNYQQFGRCFDVTNEKVQSDYMIIYPCKQDPSGTGKVLWNHKLYYSEPTSGASAPQRMTVVHGTTYCLTTPAPGVSPAHVRLSACTAGQATQQWVRTGEVTGNYAASYTITDTYGRCLSVGPDSGMAGGWSTIVAASCSGGAGQKWNAPPNAVEARITGTREVPRA